jgi:hypothetical protein
MGDCININDKQKYVIVPGFLIRNQETRGKLSVTDIAIYSRIYKLIDYSIEQGWVTETGDMYAKMSKGPITLQLDIPQEDVDIAIKRLKEFGLLETEIGSDGSIRYFPLLPEMGD